MKSLLHIGADADKLKDAIPEIATAIVRILETSAGDTVKMKAVEAISASFEVRNVNVSGCVFKGVTEKAEKAGPRNRRRE